MIPRLPVALSAPASRPFQSYLEALRGVAALVVVVRHAVLFAPKLLPGFALHGPWAYLPPGHLSVLVFFTLSGFVIGLSNPQPLATSGQVGQYLAKRFIRLYPIYLLSLAITVAVAGLAYQHWYPAGVLAYHAAFLQVAAGPVFAENLALWSLDYEVGYYLLFVGLSGLRLRPGWVLGAALVLGVATSLAPRGLSPALASYAYGMALWLAGLVLARCPATPAFDPGRWFARLLSFLFLFLSFERMNLFETLAKAAHLDVALSRVANEHQQIVHFSDLAYLPFCVAGILLFTNRQPRGYRWLVLGLYLTPLLYLVAYVASGKAGSAAGTPPLVAGLCYALSLVVYLAPSLFNAPGQRVLVALVPLGSISYGIYVVHFPLLLLVGAWAGGPAGGLGYLLRFCG